MDAPAPPPRRFSPERLARLMETASAVQCECSNHVAKLVEALAAFEDYSRGCQNRNAADAEVHAMLARSAADARVVMEDALVRLCAFEGIPVGSDA